MRTSISPIGFKREGLTVSTVGLFLRGLPEIRIDVNSPSLLGECEPFLRFVTDYLSQTGARIELGETMAYGYWLVRFQEATENLMAVWEYEPEATHFVPGGSLTLQYWRDQHRVCQEHKTDFVPPRPDRLTVVSAGVLEGLPVQAVRYPSPEQMSGWWLITEKYDGNIKSLKHEHTYHVTAARHDLAPFLALPYGFRFDLTHGEDAWYDVEVAQQPA